MRNAILDGEIVCVDADGRSQFNQLLFRRGTPIFAAFDLLWHDGEDLRALALIQRKRRLSAVVPRRSASILYVSHIATHGVALFNQVCDQDLEGVVGKWAAGSYCCDGVRTSWVKVKNPDYSQAIGRRELFERRARPRKTATKVHRLVLT